MGVEQVPSLTELVRESCAAVMDRAAFVTIDHQRLHQFAVELQSQIESQPSSCIATSRLQDQAPKNVERRALLVFSLDAINFGSGYHDIVDKYRDLSGAQTMAHHLRTFEQSSGPLTATRLGSLTDQDCSTIFQQPRSDPDLWELMELFGQALRALGAWLDSYGSSAASALAAADGSAERLAQNLLAMPFYQDSSPYWHQGHQKSVRSLRAHFYKRAQITAADLDRELGGSVFNDLDRLTAFADNLVPHVLKIEGILRFDHELEDSICRGELLEPGSAPEIEIRASGVHVVERLSSLTGIRAMDLDLALWKRGGAQRYKSVPRHRSRSVYY